MEWQQLNKLQELDTIKSISEKQPVLIFKHSTRCPVSSMAINRLERSWDDDKMQGLQSYYLDLIANRDISDEIASVFNVPHESPQVLVIKDGKCIYDQSHMGITYQELMQFV